jgi:hypothetical protein
MAKNVALAAYKAGAKLRSTGKRRRKSLTLPLAVAAGFAPLTIHAYYDFKSGGIASVADGMARRLTGFGTPGSGGGWTMQHFGQGLYPIIGGILVHKFVGGNLGVNRMLAKAGVPLLRL